MRHRGPALGVEGSHGGGGGERTFSLPSATTCDANTAPPPCADRGLLAFATAILEQEYVRCGRPATHTYSGRLLCDACAAKLREALADERTMGNVLLGRARTPEEIARLVKRFS